MNCEEHEKYKFEVEVKEMCSRTQKTIRNTSFGRCEHDRNKQVRMAEL